MLKFDKTTDGPDKICIDIIKKVPKWSSFLIHLICVKSLYEGEVPHQLKNADIVPLLKDPKSNKHTFKNYRPISVTSVVARIIEKVIKKRIVDTLNENSVIPVYQFGGRSKIGTTDALCHVWTNIQNNTAKYKETNVIFLDISKAFDRLIRELIIWKLKFVCKVSDPLVMWTHKFLLNRKQRIKIWGSTSKWLTTKSGGPQGCVLTPILFAMYICDIPLDSQTLTMSEQRSSWMKSVVFPQETVTFK